MQYRNENFSSILIMCTMSSGLYSHKMTILIEEKNRLESRDKILERHFQSRFLGINLGLLSLQFLSCFLLSFFHSTKCYSWIDSSFPVSRNFKTREEYDFLKIRLKKRLWIAWSKRLKSFVKLMSKNIWRHLSALKSQFLKLHRIKISNNDSNIESLNLRLVNKSF